MLGSTRGEARNALARAIFFYQKVAESLAKLLLKAGVYCPTLDPQSLSGDRESVIRSRRRSAKGVFPNSAGGAARRYAFQIRRSRLCLAIPDNNLAAP